MEVIENGNTPRDKISLNGLGMKKVKCVNESMMLKRGMEVDQYYTVFNYGPRRPHKDLNYQDRTIMDQPGINTAPKFVLPGHRKEKFGKEPPPQMR